jgi:hypothetical protein
MILFGVIFQKFTCTIKRMLTGKSDKTFFSIYSLHSKRERDDVVSSSHIFSSDEFVGAVWVDDSGAHLFRFSKNVVTCISTLPLISFYP